jgi:hypothetical protein
VLLFLGFFKRKEIGKGTNVEVAIAVGKLQRKRYWIEVVTLIEEVTSRSH